MGRFDSPPFGRGCGYYNDPVRALKDLVSNTGMPTQLGGTNLEGKEFTFEENSQDYDGGIYSAAAIAAQSPNGRPIHCKVLRNRTNIYLQPGRLVHFDETGQGNNGSYYNSASNMKNETGTDGYCYQLSDRPAGIVDEFVSGLGVAPNELFWCVIDGPTMFTQGATTASTFTTGSIAVPATYGSSRTDNLAGRVGIASFAGASGVLAQNIMNAVGVVETANSTAGQSFSGVVKRFSKS
jgi:hypothetical protein